MSLTVGHPGPLTVLAPGSSPHASLCLLFPPLQLSASVPLGRLCPLSGMPFPFCLPRKPDQAHSFFHCPLWCSPNKACGLVFTWPELEAFAFVCLEAIKALLSAHAPKRKGTSKP